MRYKAVIPSGENVTLIVPVNGGPSVCSVYLEEHVETILAAMNAGYTAVQPRASEGDWMQS